MYCGIAEMRVRQKLIMFLITPLTFLDQRINKTNLFLINFARKRLLTPLRTL